MAETILDKLKESAKGPKSVEGDEGTVVQHPIPDLIEADRYDRSMSAQSRKRGGVRFQKIQPPSAE
jgi:hypothetical protein